MKTGLILLSILILFQGCSIYKGSITLDEAVAEQKRVKVTTTQNDQPLKFQRIEYINREYKGIVIENDRSQDIKLSKEDISRIKEYDKTASDVFTFTPLVLIVALGVLMFTNLTDGGN